ncbi:MAG TPA: hypothetical protein VF607_07220, partial [Verrucomicrobiae bacterium]
VTVNGPLVLNGAVTLKVSASGLAAGSYPLIAYGSSTGAGSFVLGTVPAVTAAVATLTNDTSAKVWKLVYTPLTALNWDAGNTANGAILDAGSGVWDFNVNNPVWNTNASNLSWLNTVAAIFGGTDGNWTISLATNVAPTALVFAASGYRLTAAAAETLALTTSGSGTVPNLQVGAGKSASIGANVTVQTSGAANLILGGPAGTGNPAGALNIEASGLVQVSGSATLGLVGDGTTLNVLPGGALGRTSSGTFLLGSTTGDNCVLNVNGGTVTLTGSGNVRLGGNSSAGAVAGTLNLNSGMFTMDALNTTVPLTLGVNAGNLGTNNLNGGVLSVNQIVKGNAAATAVLNFNGGTLQAVNGALGTNFLNGLTAANVRNGGAVIDNRGFNLTVGQALVHSPQPDDQAVDGGLLALGSGSLFLTNVCAYNGNTVVSNGTLGLTGSGAIAASARITLVSPAAKLDVTAVGGGFVLASGQTLGGVGSVAGSVTGAANSILSPGNQLIGTLTCSN